MGGGGEGRGSFIVFKGTWYSLTGCLRQIFIFSNSERCLEFKRFVDRHYANRKCFVLQKLGLKPAMCMCRLTSCLVSTSYRINITEKGNGMPRVSVSFRSRVNSQ